MKPDIAKNILQSEIKNIASNSEVYSIKPKSDFTRKRKLPLETIVTTIIGLENKNLTNELLDIFNCSSKAATASAFIKLAFPAKPTLVKNIDIKNICSTSSNPILHMPNWYKPNFRRENTSPPITASGIKKPKATYMIF